MNENKGIVYMIGYVIGFIIGKVIKPVYDLIKNNKED